MIDLHSHLLPGLDDGPETMDQSVAMARAAWRSGTLAMVCTPHMMKRIPTAPAAVHAGVAALREQLRAADIPLELHGGGEISLDHLHTMSDDDLAMACLGHGRWLLVEFPFRGWPLGLAHALRDLEIRGFGAILAHPERAEAVQRAPDRLRDIIGRGALVQITADSFAGENGPIAQRTAVTLLKAEAAHFIASDAHSAGPWRPPGIEDGLAAAAQALRLEPEALRWMVEEGPAAVIEGRPVKPPRFMPSRRPREGGYPAPAGPR